MHKTKWTSNTRSRLIPLVFNTARNELNLKPVQFGTFRIFYTYCDCYNNTEIAQLTLSILKKELINFPISANHWLI